MLTSRLANLKKLLQKNSIDAALISSVTNIIYLTNFTSFSEKEREAYLLVSKNGQYIFTDGRYSHSVKKNVKDFQLLEISGKSSFTDQLKKIVQSDKIATLGIENNNLTVAEHKKISPLVKNLTHFDLTELRMIKDKTELAHIKKACELGDIAFKFILTRIKEGVSESEIAFELELFIRRQNAAFSFDPIIAFEENAAIPHHKTGDRILGKNEFILLDFGVRHESYCSDMTRTIFKGLVTSEKRKAYEIVLSSQRNAEDVLVSELSKNNSAGASLIDQTARDYIISQKYPSIPHSLGHGIGLDVHEAPALTPGSKDALREGMVFSIEPGIYLNDAFGIRIEDLYAIENGKLIQLTKSPKELIML